MESSRIFVRGLPTSLGANDFQSHFSTQYPTTDAKLIPYRRIGYVGYKTPQDAANAVKYYNKTFIRMSRIGVEIARSIEEQSALRPGTNATNRVKRKYGDTEADSPHMRKRYDGIQAVEETAKLQEFLEVMQPPSKSKIWEDQAAMTTQTPAEPSMNDRDRQNSDAGIDEEYEPVPKRQKRNREIAQETQLKSGDSQMETDLHEHKSAVSAAGGDVTLPLVNTAGAGSDADWLRTRTSRLLGLVDDDDAQETIALPDDDQAQKSTASGDLEQNPSKNVLDTSIQTEREGNKVDTSSAEVPSANAQGSCVGNGRLFIRNLAYSATEDDLRLLLENGKHGAIEEVS